MNLLTLTYNELLKEYSYFISPTAPSNCHILDFKNYSDIKIEGNYILFIGCVWYGADVSMASSLGDIAPNYPNLKFYFKLILAENELESAVPKEIPLEKLPIILIINHLQPTIVSTGVISRDELNNKILKLSQS